MRETGAKVSTIHILAFLRRGVGIFTYWAVDFDSGDFQIFRDTNWNHSLFLATVAKDSWAYPK